MKLAIACIGALLLCGAALAQETVAIAVDGWQQSIGRDQIVKYRCASTHCAAGSVVSYKAQPHHYALTLAQFEAHHLGLTRQATGTGRIRTARVYDAKERTIDGVRVLQVSREVVWDTGAIFSIEGRLVGPERSYSLVSDSPAREWSENNFEGFLRSLTGIAGIRR